MRIKRKSVEAILYDEEYYKTKNHGYIEFLHGYHLPQQFENFVKKYIKKNDSVLDIGCGRGEIVIMCSKKGIKCYGIDYSPDAVRICKDGLRKMEFKTSLVKVMNVKNLEYKDRIFDVIVMLDVVEHLYPWELERALKEIYRVLKRGGKVLIHTSPNANNMIILRKLAKLFKINFASNKYHVNEQNPTSIMKLVSKKFKVIYFEKVKDKEYFSKQAGSHSKLIKILTIFLDNIYDSNLFNTLMKCNFFANILCTDIYIVGEKI